MTARGNAKLVSMTKRSSGVDNSPDPASEQGLLRQVAHDLRQPVAAILALAAAAESVPDVPVPVLRRLDQISEEAGWIFKVIGELLADGGQGTEPVAIDALIRDVVDSERLTFPGQIRLWQPAGDVRYVTAASTRLRRALANVLANATRAAGPQGHVELVVRSHGNTQIIEIIDDGPASGCRSPGRSWPTAAAGWRSSDGLPTGPWCGSGYRYCPAIMGQVADESRTRRRPAAVRRRGG
jgi:K+-sensing histidine kinase KdpD